VPSRSTEGVVPVNIVVRTRDRPLLLGRALDDVLGQSFADWRVTIVNDGGDRGAVERLVAERAAAFGGRVSILHNEGSSGMEAASNQGVRALESLFVAIHDDDDTWHPDFLATTVAWLDDNLDAAAVAVRTEIVWEQIQGQRVIERGREIFAPERRLATLFDLLRWNHCVPISTLYRRAAIVETGWFDESLLVVGDWEFNVRLAARAYIGFLPDVPLAFWHQRRNATGSLGNSVTAGRAAHADFDRLVRDRELRAYVRDNGLGLPMFVAKLVDDRADELRRQLTDTPVRRVARAVRDSFRRVLG